MKNNLFWLSVILLTLALFSSSCGKRQHINLTKEELNFAGIGGEDIVPIEADCEWTVEVGDLDWIKISPTSGKNNGAIIVKVAKNTTFGSRSAVIIVNSSNGKVRKTINVYQETIAIVNINNKTWFLYEYERWATDYKDDYIPDSYEHWNYYIDEQFDNWFFYFQEDSTGYEIHTKLGDTIVYAYNYIYYPFGDSLYINFQTDSTVVEDYHATIHQLNHDRFQFSDEFSPHRFENLFMANISTNRTELKINPKQVRKKERGPIIQMEQ